MRRRQAIEDDRAAFMLRWQAEDAVIRERIVSARKSLRKVRVPDTALEDIAALCLKLGADGLRGELTLLKAARAHAAYRDDTAVGRTHIRETATLALRHRLRRDPLDEAGSGTRVARIVEDVLA